MRKTKMVVTLGPSLKTPVRIRQALVAGADVFRLNFSHGTLAEHGSLIHLVRRISRELSRPVAVLADLPGPKLRTGELEGGPVFLRTGGTCVLTARKIKGSANVIPVLYRGLPKHLTRGDRILLADGLLDLRVSRVEGDDIFCRILVGGELGEHKGINVPGKRLPIPAVTSKDREAIRFIGRHEVDYVALSFVQDASDVSNARAWIRKGGRDLPIIAKIEKPAAIRNIEAILRVSDGIMIARGDLGVELPTSEIPVVQKQLVHLAAQRGVPVITATQMLDSMIHNPRPTRAETTDVANAIWDGSDAVMLSNETAAGQYPIETIRTMADIIENAERHPMFGWVESFPHRSGFDSGSVLEAATHVCRSGYHKAIVTYTQSGSTAIALSKLRPGVPILALTPDLTTYRRLALIWGVTPFVSPQGRNVDDMIARGDRILLRKAQLKPKDRVILVAGTRLSSGATNMLKIHQVGEAFRRGRK